jgi:hypothetical protein
MTVVVAAAGDIDVIAAVTAWVGDIVAAAAHAVVAAIAATA